MTSDPTPETQEGRSLFLAPAHDLLGVKAGLETPADHEGESPYIRLSQLHILHLKLGVAEDVRVAKFGCKILGKIRSDAYVHPEFRQRVTERVRYGVFTLWRDAAGELGLDEVYTAAGRTNQGIAAAPGWNIRTRELTTRAGVV